MAHWVRLTLKSRTKKNVYINLDQVRYIAPGQTSGALLSFDGNHSLGVEEDIGTITERVLDREKSG